MQFHALVDHSLPKIREEGLFVLYAQEVFLKRMLSTSIVKNVQRKRVLWILEARKQLTASVHILSIFCLSLGSIHISNNDDKLYVFETKVNVLFLKPNIEVLKYETSKYKTNIDY